ncbi:putative reverse transcriptase [Trichinella nativa]|uniref:RNA-directed DNA polymerase n=1 Tax=Trichinella nativa TaxID=6335 RepID=A0A1Y3ET52_9BILA|nr:putative reverse transcriptase [Trichinella nativa]
MTEQKTMLSAQQSTESAQRKGTATFPIGTHRPFNPEEGTWDTWILQFRSYLEINFISDSNLMRSCLLASLTPKAFEELRRSCLPTTPYDFTYDECVAKMKELYRRRVILMRERANFFRITQSDHQTLKQFANSLREAAGHCNFESFNTEAALVLQFINGMKNEEIKLRNEGLKARRRFECMSLLWRSRTFCKEMQVPRLKVLQVWEARRSGKSGKHPQKPGKSQKQRPQHSWKDHKLYADGIYAVKECAHDFEVTVKINGKSTRMELDTGAAVTTVTPECWKSIGSPKLKRATVMLRSFTGHEVNLKGETMVTVEGDTGTRKLVLRVAKNGATNVMGQDWISAFGASDILRPLLTNKKEVNAVESRTQNDVCAEFPEVFEDGLGHCTKVKAHVELKDGVVPVFRKPFPLAFAMHDAVGKELERYVDMGVLTPIDRSAWAAPIVTVLRGWKTFTKLDLSDAYLQVELDEESKRILVINTHKGLYHYNRLPFGVASAPAIFQKVMNTMLAGIPNVAAYLDDIILTGATDDEHRRTLKLVLGRLKESGLRIRKEKCTFFQKKVEYLGDILSSKGIRADPNKTAAIVNMPLPTNIAKLRSFLDMCNYYTEFVPKLADMCSPLNKLLRKDARWKWTGEHTKAVERVKRLLNSPLLLTHYHPEWSIVLAADASNKGIGAVVYHRFSDGTVKVITHASKKLNAAERNYGQIEKEALALVYGLKKFHKFLWGRRFTLLTDHKPLVTIFGSKKGVPQMAACRLTRGIENLEEQKRKMENTSGNRADRQFKISETVMVRDYTRDRKLWREGVIVGQQGQVTRFVQVGRIRWKRHTNQMRHKNTGIADGQEEKDNEMGSLLDEALPAGNSPERNAAADENVQDTETLNIFQNQTSTPPEGSVDSPKATVHAESSSTTVETGDREHKPDGSVSIKQDEVLQKPRRSNRVRKPPNRLSI